MHLPRLESVFFGGVSGNADEAVNALLAGNLGYNPMYIAITMIMKQVTAVAIMAAEVIPAINI